MKCETPALPSVSSREPAPIQKPSATERTLGIRSERTYFCTPALSLAGPADRQGHCRDQLAVRLKKTVHELVDLGQRQLRCGMRIEHGRVIDVLPLPGERRLDGEGLHVQVRLDQPGELERQRSDSLRGDSALVGDAGHLNAALREVVDQTVVHERNDLQAVGAIFLASHASLRDDYEVCTPKLDAIVTASLEAGALGARMTGGGFGGSVVAVTERGDADAVLRGTLARAGAQGWIVEACSGASRRRTGSRQGRA